MRFSSPNVCPPETVRQTFFGLLTTTIFHNDTFSRRQQQPRRPQPLFKITHSHTLRALLLTAALSGCAPAFAQQVPLVADFPMEKVGDTSPDRGPLNLELKVQDATVVPGKIGNALRFDGKDSLARIRSESLDKMGSFFTITMWAKIERFLADNRAYLVQKGDNTGWQFGVGTGGQGTVTVTGAAAGMT